MFPFLESKLDVKIHKKHEYACQRMSLMCELGYQLTYISQKERGDQYAVFCWQRL